jgi:CheY-like chemotaxis protein
MAFSRFKPNRKDVLSDVLPQSRPRVLYVEDEDVNWEITENELERRFDLSRARSAREAFTLLSQDAYHLILLDLQLSGSDIDGIAVARLLKGRYIGAPPHYAVGIRAVGTPIIFVTAYTARYSKEELLEAGGDDLIPKPVNFTHLSLAVARVWARGTAKGG